MGASNSFPAVMRFSTDDIKFSVYTVASIYERFRFCRTVKLFVREVDYLFLCVRYFSLLLSPAANLDQNLAIDFVLFESNV